MVSRIVIWVLLLGICVDLPGQAPRLVLPLGHAGWINSVAFSPDGTYILTGSADNTAKLWSINGKEIQTYNEHSKEISVAAFTPDGEYVITASEDNTVNIWRIDGKKIRSLNRLGDKISSMVCSPDGKLILNGYENGQSTAKLWDLAGSEIQKFDWFRNECAAVAFSPDGNLVFTGNDFGVKVWRRLDGWMNQSIVGVGSVTSIAVSPNGKFILVGNESGTAILTDLTGQKIQEFEVGEPQNLLVTASPNALSHEFPGQIVKPNTMPLGNEPSFIRAKPENRPLKGPVHCVAISPDGKYVLAGNIDGVVSLWSINGKKIHSFNAHYAEITSVAFSPDGKYLLTGSKDKTAKLWDWLGKRIQVFGGHYDGVYSAAFSPDGKFILAGNGQTPKLWNLEKNEIFAFKKQPDKVISVDFSPSGKYILTGGMGYATLWDIDGNILKLYKSSDRAYTFPWELMTIAFFSVDENYIITKRQSETKAWNFSGNESHDFNPEKILIESELNFKESISPDGKFILKGSTLFNYNSNEELATLIPIDSTDWVVTTPSGLFDASPGAMKLMYYVQGLEVIELDQLKDRYYEPGLLAKIMGFDKSELRDVKAFTEVALYPEINAGIEKDQLAVELTERNGGLGKLSLFINGKEVQEDINTARQKNLTVNLNTFAKYYRTDTTNTLALRAYNAEGWLKSQAYELTYVPAQAKGNELPSTAKPISRAKPSLYTLAIGTSKYAGDHHLDLKFADLDAEALAKAVSGAGSALFSPDNTHVRLLTSTAQTPTDICAKTNIRQAFHDIAAKAKPEDVVIVFFSGHGLAYGPAEKEQFYYLTKDIGSEKLDDKDIREAYTISSEELTRWLTDIPAQKQVMIIDACNAGKAVESLAAVVSKEINPSQIRALDRMKDRTGMFILTGSAADKVSYEASQYGQGLLTYSLLQGMSGLALTEDKRVDVMTLFQYSRDKVPELAKGIGGIQTPVLAFPTGGASFDIGIVTPQVKIPVAQVKPVFIRNNFTNEVSFTDDLKLTRALENYFRNITVRGAEADLIFVDVSEYENAWSIKGLYTVAGEAVQVRGRLFKGEVAQGEFQASGAKSDIPGLVKKIVEQVQGMIK